MKIGDKLNLRYGEYVYVRNTGSELDGIQAYVIGVSVRGLVDIYILEFLDNKMRTMPDGMQYHAFTMPEVCLERS